MAVKVLDDGSRHRKRQASRNLGVDAKVEPRSMDNEKFVALMTKWSDRVLNKEELLRSKLRVRLDGDTRRFELTGPSIIENILKEHPNSNLFLHFVGFGHVQVLAIEVYAKYCSRSNLPPSVVSGERVLWQDKEISSHIAKAFYDSRAPISSMNDFEKKSDYKGTRWSRSKAPSVVESRNMIIARVT
ncbi:uncharacterized protein HKW66_Vig0081240 [Vigna angularis]|uniref:DUF7796 domain-containing protein n=1 Tax=Phaseolus angularis TaxID=3914 RepID=A0A8T0KIA9_PHAAN|nr:uncharacterized protein HKW66_Vig0081240 [Vigna angularis]